MPVKILHTADLHMDSPFDSLPEEKAIRRRGEQRALLDRICSLAETERVQIMLLSGDLFDSDTSYYETYEELYRAFSGVRADIFIAPGNHDWYSPLSPYATLAFPENVHIFKTPSIRSFELPELNCRVWGTGFNAPLCSPLLTGFSTGGAGMIEIMAMHGELTGDTYNHISENEIAASGLDYLALGHVHTFSGFKKAGKTTYAYPGCPEGRGFDETGEKGVIIGEVDKGSCSLRFVPTALREYAVITADLTGADDAVAAVLSAIPAGSERNICRVVLTGDAPPPDLTAVAAALEGRFFHFTLRDRTRPPRDIWAGAGDDTLRGIFLRRMRDRYEAADSGEKDLVLAAVQYGLAAIEGREAPQ